MFCNFCTAIILCHKFCTSIYYRFRVPYFKTKNTFEKGAKLPSFWYFKWDNRQHIYWQVDSEIVVVVSSILFLSHPIYIKQYINISDKTLATQIELWETCYKHSFFSKMVKYYIIAYNYLKYFLHNLHE